VWAHVNDCAWTTVPSESKSVTCYKNRNASGWQKI